MELEEQVELGIDVVEEEDKMDLELELLDSNKNALVVDVKEPEEAVEL